MFLSFTTAIILHFFILNLNFIFFDKMADFWVVYFQVLVKKNWFIFIADGC